MTARIDPAICWNCRHEAASKNLTCPCPFCHLVYLGSSVPAPTPSPGSFHGGGGRNPVVPARHTFPSAAGRDRTYPASSWGWWLAAAVSLMVVGFGAVNGWHTTPVDTVAAIVVPLSLILGGVFWPERKGGE